MDLCSSNKPMTMMNLEVDKSTSHLGSNQFRTISRLFA
jgi:hypothetical protein